MVFFSAFTVSFIRVSRKSSYFIRLLNQFVDSSIERYSKMALNMIEVFAPNAFVDCVISHVEGPRKFFAQPISAAPDLRRLTKRLQVLYGTTLFGEGEFTLTLDEVAKTARLGMPCWCAAPFHVDTPANTPEVPTYYYRALIMERTGPSTVNVFFVDYGNAANVPIGSLKILPISMREQPPLAVPCRLIDGEVDTGAMNVIDPERLRTAVDGYHVVVHVLPNQPLVINQKLPHIADPIWVSLYVTDGKEEVNVGETLIGELLAKQQGTMVATH